MYNTTWTRNYKACVIFLLDWMVKVAESEDSYKVVLSRMVRAILRPPIHFKDTPVLL